MATINPKLSVTEIVAICDDAEAKVLFLDATMTENLNGIEFRTIKKLLVSMIIWSNGFKNANQ